MMPGETIRSGAAAVCDCGTPFYYEVLDSPAGYFVGTICHNQKCEHCGEPNSRESHYYPSRAACQRDLDEGTVAWR